MPFKIIRNDITKVRADAIVNTANPEPCYAGGTDAAIYHAAGAEELLSAREEIGRIAPGDAVATAAYALPARYIIHTVGPAWIDGRHGEFEILHSCYRKSMLLADQLECKSIAFPLIATGVYGFPKDRALETALSAIREHLVHSDLDVTLVVFEQSAYQLAAGLTEEIEAYIDENYVAPPEMGMSALPEENICEADLCASAPMASYAAPQPRKGSLEDAINNLGETFQERLLRMICERGMTDPEVYKRANIDRKHFSKIRKPSYIPKKRTIVALAIALRLNLDDTRDLLASAGFALTTNSVADVIATYCIEHEIYDIYEVNALLFRYSQPLLGQ